MPQASKPHTWNRVSGNDHSTQSMFPTSVPFLMLLHLPSLHRSLALGPSLHPLSCRTLVFLDITWFVCCPDLDVQTHSWPLAPFLCVWVILVTRLASVSECSNCSVSECSNCSISCCCCCCCRSHKAIDISLKQRKVQSFYSLYSLYLLGQWFSNF